MVIIMYRVSLHGGVRGHESGGSGGGHFEIVQGLGGEELPHLAKIKYISKIINNYQSSY
jgi:hypothetical protein